MKPIDKQRGETVVSDPRAALTLDEFNDQLLAAIEANDKKRVADDCRQQANAAAIDRYVKKRHQPQTEK